MLKIVVVGPIHEEGMKLLHARSDFAVDVLSDLSPEGIAKGVAGAHGISIRTQKLTKEMLAQAPDLRVVSRHGVGFDNVDVAYLSSRKIPMALAVASNFTAVGEHTLMMMLCIAKDAFACDEAVRRGDFDFRHKGTMSDLFEKQVLIMGLGRIGRRVADLCLAFGMRVCAYDPFVPQSAAPTGVEMVADFRAALPTL
ncbi:MAG: 3-phosphoglycerate dehydrogenase, partial [Deltaproteobacteria bacterium]|nr:3-phosphoglycerate dehydrogenase [Deltaproteobacteria bacterium]